MQTQSTVSLFVKKSLFFFSSPLIFLSGVPPVFFHQVERQEKKKAKPRMKAQTKETVPSASKQSAICNSQWLVLT